jgi:hypothetical protein
MGRIYSVPATFSSTTAIDLLELAPATQKPCKLRGWRISQTTEVGDSQEEDLRITVRRFSTLTTGSGGSTITGVPMDSADAAAGFTAKCGNTTLATTGGTNTVVEEMGWNERNTPCDFWYPDERFCPKVKNAEALIVRMESTPADSITFCVTFWVEEE